LSLALVIAAGCGGAANPGPVPLAEVVLHDVQPLHGGQDLWVGADGAAFAQVVGPPKRPEAPGLWASRYRLRLTPAQVCELERLVGAHDFFHVRTAGRPGIPDEPRPLIYVRSKADAAAAAMKWAGDRHPDFDPVYEYLLGLLDGEKEEIGEGAYDGGWRPDGFPSPSEVVAVAQHP
jgi:hypothetical protein